MAKNEKGVGLVRRIGPLTTGLESGELVVHNGWPGVVQKKIIGTTEADLTIDGRPITGQLGDGLGDIQVEGVFEFNDEGGDAADGNLVKRTSPSGVTKDLTPGATSVGHVVGAAYNVEVGDLTVRRVQVKLLGRPVVS